MKRENEILIEELRFNAEVSNQKPLEQRLADTAAWFFHNKDLIPPANLQKRCDFYEKTCHLLLEIAALQLERHREATGSKTGLWLPRGLEAHGDVRKFG